MKAAVLYGPAICASTRFLTRRSVAPTDAVVRITASCVCGSDLWHYRGFTEKRGRIGHEFLGVVEQVGAEVATVKAG